MAHILMKQTNYNNLPKMPLVGQRMVFSKGNMVSYMDNLSFFFWKLIHIETIQREKHPHLFWGGGSILFLNKKSFF